MDNVKTIKTMVWELGVFSISGITLFRNYDKQRRKKEFELLKDLSRGFYRTNDISQDSIRIPVFNLDNEKVFTIQIKILKIIMKYHYYSLVKKMRLNILRNIVHI